MWRAWPSLTFDLRITNKEEISTSTRKRKSEEMQQSRDLQLADHVLTTQVKTKLYESEGGKSPRL